MTTTEHDTIRDGVARHYSNALAQAEGSCCGPSCCNPVTEQAGYSAAELDELEGGASFGCGNPLSMAAVKPGDTVLDLGSGAGLDLLLAAGLVGETGRVIGVDMTDDMIDKARANIAAAGLSDRVEVRKGLIEALPVDDASVDHVISNCVINLSPDKAAVFAEIARVLKPGGKISVSDIVAQDLPDAIRDDERLYGSCIGGAISEEEYAAGLEAAGLTDVKAVDRFVYDEATVMDIAGSELVGLADSGLVELAKSSCCGPATPAASSCCGGASDASDADRVKELAKMAVGRFWSVRFTGTRVG